MFESIFIYLFVFIIFLVMFLEYRNDKKYQAKRDNERKRYTPKEPAEPEIIPEEVIEEEPERVEETQPEAVEEVKPEKTFEPEIQPEEIIEKKPEEVEKVQPEAVEPEEVIEEIQPEVVLEEVEEAKELPSCEYPPFTHVRLVEMGLSDDEATEFVNDLIPQLEEQIPLIEEAINSADFHQIERVTHGIKGSASNIGTGGVSDLLVEFNTYLKSGTDPDIVKAYQKYLIHYTKELKKQYA